MEIQEIKQRLSILTVLAYYNLTADRHNKMHCPFHDDTTPSFQLYPNTNTWCCFSANCKAGTGDVIEFIQLKDNCSKHEALVRAKLLIVGQYAEQAITSNTPVIPSTSMLERITVLTKAFQQFHKALPHTKRAVTYMQSRGLDYKQTAAGIINANYHHDCNKDFIQNLATYHLLKPLPAKGYSIWAKECIIFPLRDANNNIVSLYGRSIMSETDTSTSSTQGKHFYLKDICTFYDLRTGV